MRWLCAALLLGALAGAPDAQVADSLARPATPPAALDTLTRTPQGAVTRALLLPGLGQVYNQQPVKAPVAAAVSAASLAA